MKLFGNRPPGNDAAPPNYEEQWHQANPGLDVTYIDGTPFNYLGLPLLTDQGRARLAADVQPIIEQKKGDLRS